MVSWYGLVVDDDQRDPPFQISSFPEDLKLRLRVAAHDADLSMSELAVRILDEHLPPLPERRT